MYWDRFDIIEAHYAYYTENHGGLWSPEYRRLCRIGEYFKPGLGRNGYQSLTENGKAIYDNLAGL